MKEGKGEILDSTSGPEQAHSFTALLPDQNGAFHFAQDIDKNMHIDEDKEMSGRLSDGEEEMDNNLPEIGSDPENFIKV